MKLKISKKGQEEMIGFGIIIVIVAIILLVFLWFSTLSPNKSIESYEAESFVNVMLHYTSDCVNSRSGVYMEVKDLVYKCYDKETCGDGRDTCSVLNDTIKGILEESWKIGPNRPLNGYNLVFLFEEEVFLMYKEGNLTGDSKGYWEILPKSLEIEFSVYSKPLRE